MGFPGRSQFLCMAVFKQRRWKEPGGFWVTFLTHA